MLGYEHIRVIVTLGNFAHNLAWTRADIAFPFTNHLAYNRALAFSYQDLYDDAFRSIQ